MSKLSNKTVTINGSADLVGAEGAALTAISRSVDLLLRLKVDEVRKDRNQKQMIRFLGGLGATAAEVSSLLQISRKTVDPELSKARAEVNGKSLSSGPVRTRRRA